MFEFAETVASVHGTLSGQTVMPKIYYVYCKASVRVVL